MTPDEQMRAADAELPGCLAITAFVLLIALAGMAVATYYGVT